MLVAGRIIGGILLVFPVLSSPFTNQKLLRLQSEVVLFRSKHGTLVNITFNK